MLMAAVLAASLVTGCSKDACDHYVERLEVCNGGRNEDPMIPYTLTAADMVDICHKRLADPREVRYQLDLFTCRLSKKGGCAAFRKCVLDTFTEHLCVHGAFGGGPDTSVLCED